MQNELYHISLAGKGKKHLIPPLPDHIVGLIAQYAVEPLPMLYTNPKMEEEKKKIFTRKSLTKSF